MNKEIDTINIPAFKRKRSIAAKERRTNTAALKAKKPRTTKKRTTSRTRNTTRNSRSSLGQKTVEELTLMDEIQTIDLFDADEIPQAKTGRKVREFKLIGRCEGYFEKIDVAVIKLSSAIRTGDIILIAMDKGMFEQEVKSMQINGKDVALARTGSDIGMKINKKPLIGTAVYKLID